MARPTIREQQIIKARNRVIRELVNEQNYAQSEVAKWFNLHRVVVNQIINERDN